MRWTFVTVWVLGGGLLVGPMESGAADTITVPLAGVATWTELLERQDETGEARAQPFVPPFKSAPDAELEQLPGGLPLPEHLSAQAGTGVSTTSSRLAPVRGFEAIHATGPSVPDTDGAVGPQHVMTMLNTGVRIQTKQGADLGFVDLNTFWSPALDALPATEAGPVAQGEEGGMGDAFDPRLIYDSLAERWIATVDADAFLPTSRSLFAISASSDPTGTWFFYSFEADPAGLEWTDFPGFGVNSTWIAITNNMYPVPDGPTLGAKMWVIDKATALAGGALTVTVFPTGFASIAALRGFAMQPAVTFDAAEPILYLIEIDLHLGNIGIPRLSRISGSGPAPTWSAVSSPLSPLGLFVSPLPWDWSHGGIPVGPEQPGVPNTCAGGPLDGQPCVYFTDCGPSGACRRITANDSRAQTSPSFRHGTLWYVNEGGLPADAPDHVAVFWYQISPELMAATGFPVVQFGVLDSGTRVSHYLPSIAVNANDDVCIGFSRSGPDTFIEGVEATRLGSDPPGTMGPIHITKAGEDAYLGLFVPSGNRWGDYSATVVDPSDDLSFWTLQQYAAHNVGDGDDGSRWGTWWALKSRVSAGAPVLSPLGLIAIASALLLVGARLIRRRAR